MLESVITARAMTFIPANYTWASSQKLCLYKQEQQDGMTKEVHLLYVTFNFKLHLKFLHNLKIVAPH